MAVMDQIKRAGAEKVGMVTRPETPKAGPAPAAAKPTAPANSGGAKDRRR
jgi:hypothetical protein